jgi:hypothetical protein
MLSYEVVHKWKPAYLVPREIYATIEIWRRYYGFLKFFGWQDKKLETRQYVGGPEGWWDISGIAAEPISKKEKIVLDKSYEEWTKIFGDK